MIPRAPLIAPAGRWSDLTRRMGSGLVLLIVGVALLVSHGLWMQLGVAILFGGLMWELVRLTAGRVPSSRAPRHALLVALVSAAALLVIMLEHGLAAWPLILAPILAAWRGIAPAFRVAFVLFTLGMALAADGLAWIREGVGLATALWIVATVVQSDVLGYFVGRSVGGPKFWPSLSPKKTWSGTAAGWVGAALLALGLVAVGKAGWGAVVLGPMLALAGQMGDIAESWLKRRAGAKDSSDLIPGHGGLMDRFDAMTGALAAAFLIGLVAGLPRIGG
ncbi:MAG TPA: phosphatidate cytidylyltransferase [Paracoccus sp. (in: a-proteobacteria)]|nr:phosphatidate cytidylyltransferase [Paracoccus sp. (in: a-proteobacteria)]